LTNGGTLRLSEEVTDLTTQTQFTLGTGGGVIDNNGFNATLSGLVTAGTLNTTTGITGTGSLTSTGTGTLTLSGVNTYSGNTIVSAGTLVVSETGSLVFAPTSNGVSNKVTGAGLLIVDGAFNLDLSGANVASGNTWTLVDSTSPDYDPDTFNVTSNLGDFAESPSGVHSLTDGGNTWTFTESTGQLTLGVSALSGYASWIDGFGLALADQDPTDDPDNDGMNNLLEFVLNGNPTLSDSSILPKLVVTATDFEFTYQRRDDSVSSEITQTFQWGTNLLDWPGSAAVPATSAPVGVATVSVSAGIPDDAATDTVKISIPKSEAGASGKLFGRLQVVKP
jgi:autotransporter-associated beta strand protein